MQEKLYYIQSIKHGGYVGNSVLWWRKNNQGYTCNLENAQTYTEKEARDICEHYTPDYVVWDKDFIESVKSYHVDGQRLKERDENTLKLKKDK